MRGMDVFGNIAVVKFPEETKSSEKKKVASKIMASNGSIKTILEKSGKFKGRLRTMETKYISGEKTKEVLYRENGCVFRFNIDTTYFSPRLSNERKEIASLIKKGEEVLVMFAGVAPFPIVIAKHSSAAKIYSNELNRKANKYAQLNIELNKLKNRVELLPGDAKKVAEKLKNKGKKYDVIVMPRPQLRDSFLSSAFSLSKRGTRIYYYDFCGVEETKDIIDKVKTEARKARKKIRILNSKIAGEIAPYRVRYRVDFKIL